MRKGAAERAAKAEIGAITKQAAEAKTKAIEEAEAKGLSKEAAQALGEEAAEDVWKESTRKMFENMAKPPSEVAKDWGEGAGGDVAKDAANKGKDAVVKKWKKDHGQ